MADRQLKITIRTEMKKGFEALSKQLEAVSNQLNKLNTHFDKVATTATRAATATGKVNQQVSQGVKLVNQYASAQDKAAAKAQQINNAVKAGQANKNQALRSEINLLNDVIKKTGDLSILNSKRNSKGQFGYGGFSAAAVKEVKAQIEAQQNAQRNLNNIDRQGVEIAKQELAIRKELAYIRKANAKGGFGGDGIPPTLFETRKGYYNRGTFIPGSPPRGPTGRGGSGIGGGGRPNLGPSQESISAAQKLYETYIKLGHALFLIKYSALTIFGASGVGYIAEQIDKFITLRNQVARTSDSIGDLGDNMKAVKDIANRTFSDVGAVGTLFSSINKYSKNLGISKEDVATVTGNISAAYAASPGTADSKAAAQYQLIQAITSNRLGGDELRSQLEQAPMVAEILQKGIGRLRGKEGAVDLRDKNNPVRTKELIQVFKDPEVTKELKQLLGQSARTFSDVSMVFKNRMVDLGEKFENYLGPTITHLANILADDKKWNSFVDGIKTATVALVAFSTALIARGIWNGGGGKAVIGAAKGIASFAGSVGQYVGGVNRAVDMGRTGGVGATMLIAGDIAKGFLPTLLRIGKAFFSVGGIIAVVVAGIVLLVARFNTLLGKFGDGVSIFDIIGAAWDGVKNTMADLADWISNSWLGTALGGIRDFLDTILKWVGKSLIDNPEVQRRSLLRKGMTNVAMVDSTTAYVEGYNNKGKLVSGVATAKQGEMGPVWNANAKGQVAITDGKGKVVDYINPDGNLPSGMKSDLPTPSGGNKKGHHKKDPWLEFIQDTTGGIIESKQLATITPAMSDVEEGIRGVQKKAADVLNLLSFDELRQKFPARAAEVDKLTAQIKEVKLAEKVKEFVMNLTDQLNSAYEAAVASGMPEYKAIDFKTKNDLLKQFLNSSTNISEYDRYNIQKSSADNSYVNQESDILEKLSPQERDSYNAALGKSRGNNFLATSEPLKKANIAARDALMNQEKLSTVFGRQKDLAQAKYDIEVKYRELGPDQVKNKEEELRILQAQYDLESRNMSDGFLGGKRAFDSFRQGLRDTASDVENVLGNAFQGLQDVLTNFITTGKLGFKDFARSIIADMAQLFVRQRLLKPLFNWLSPEGGGSGIVGGVSRVLGSIFHEGGVAGEASRSRMVHPAIFANAQRYHSGGIAGLTPDEVPAILQRGERIIPRGGSHGSSVFAPSVSIQYTAAPGKTGSNEDDAGNIAKMVQQAIRQEIVEYDRRSKMPGSDAYMARKY